MRKTASALLPSVALALIASVVVGLPADARAAGPDTAAPSEEARTHFAAGVALLKDPKEPRYEEAYREFRAAYAATPSYKILGNLGLCAMKIERDAEAIWAFDTYLKDAGPDLTGPERDQIQRDLLTLKSGLVTVRVTSEPAGAAITDVRVPITGGEIRNSYGDAGQPIDLGLRPGHHVITARLAGYVEQRWEFDAPGGALPPHAFVLEKQPTAERPTVRERPIPTAAYVSGAVTLGLLATGGFFGIRALSEHNDYVRLNDGFHVADAQSTRSTGQTLNAVTDVFLGGALVGAAVTTFFVLNRPTVEHATGAPEGAPSAAAATSSALPARVGPTWGARGGGVTAVWIF